MTPLPAATAAVAAFARRTAVAGFVQGAAYVAFAIGATFAVAGIAVRCAGSELGPSWWYLLALAPVIAAGTWRARRVAISRAAAACHLDRRLHLDGLLVAAHENALDAAWSGALAPRLRTWRTALPAVRWQELCWRPLVAVALAALVAFWPETPPVRTRAPGGLASVLAGLRERLQQATAEQRIPAETLAELGTRVAELAAASLTDNPTAWRQLDELAQRVAREDLLAKLDPGTGGERDREDRTRAAMQQAFTALQEFTRDSGVPEFARSLLQQAMREAAADPQQLARAVERLRELAARIGDSGSELAEQLARAGVERRDLERLRGLASRLRQAATPELAAGGDARRSPTAPAAPASAQGAAPTRGPGEVPPRFVDPATADPPTGLTLPAGEAAPHEWAPAGDRTADPTVLPVASEASGVVPAQGAGGATWQLQLAPRHRAIVQRFFAAGEPAAKERR